MLNDCRLQKYKTSLTTNSGCFISSSESSSNVINIHHHILQGDPNQNFLFQITMHSWPYVVKTKRGGSFFSGSWFLQHLKYIDEKKLLYSSKFSWSRGIGLDCHDRGPGFESGFDQLFTFAENLYFYNFFQKINF